MRAYGVMREQSLVWIWGPRGKKTPLLSLLASPNPLCDYRLLVMKSVTNQLQWGCQDNFIREIRRGEFLFDLFLKKGFCHNFAYKTWERSTFSFQKPRRRTAGSHNFSEWYLIMCQMWTGSMNSALSPVAISCSGSAVLNRIPTDTFPGAQQVSQKIGRATFVFCPTDILTGCAS